MSAPAAEPRTIVLFGGSFDPPHAAHVELPRRVMQHLGAALVAYVPAARQPLKRDQQQSDPRHRLAMLRLAVARLPWAQVWTDELDRAADGRPSYTVETLEALHARLGPQVRLRLLIGGDNLRQFERWRQPRRVEQLAEPVVMVRPPDTRESLLAALPTESDRARWASRMVDLPQMDVSSTTIRQRVARGEPIAGMVHPAVEAYIRRHGLYR